MARSPLYRLLCRALARAHPGLPEQCPGAAEPAPRWTRRRFVGTAAALGGAGLVPLLANPGPAPPLTLDETTADRVAVVGGGICGLTAAYRLLRSGIDVVLYEASGRMGGRILTRTGGVGTGLVTELGGEFINSDHADMLALAREFELKLFNRAEAPAAHRGPATAFFFGGQRRRESDLARLLGPLAARIAGDAALLAGDPANQLADFDRISVANYLDRHSALIPEPWVRTLIEASIRTEYGREPHQASAVQLLDNLPSVEDGQVRVLGQSDEAYCVAGGNGRIVFALWSALGERVHTGHRLIGIQARPREAVRLSFQDGRTVEVDQAIIALPFPALRGVAIEAPLPPLMRRAIAELGPGRNEKVLGGFARRVWQSPDGFVSEAWTDLGFAEVWDATQSQTERTDGALTFFLGGDQTAVLGLRERDAPTRGRAFAERLDTVLPGVLGAANGRWLRTAWGRDPYAQGSYTSYAPGQLSTFGGLRWHESADPAERRQVRFGELVFAGEHLSADFCGYMNGAAQTGRLAADAVLCRAAARAAASDP